MSNTSPDTSTVESDKITSKVNEPLLVEETCYNCFGAGIGTVRILLFAFIIRLAIRP